MLEQIIPFKIGEVWQFKDNIPFTIIDTKLVSLGQFSFSIFQNDIRKKVDSVGIDSVNKLISEGTLVKIC